MRYFIYMYEVRSISSEKLCVNVRRNMYYWLMEKPDCRGRMWSRTVFTQSRACVAFARNEVIGKSTPIMAALHLA